MESPIVVLDLIVVILFALVYFEMHFRTLWQQHVQVMHRRQTTPMNKIVRLFALSNDVQFWLNLLDNCNLDENVVEVYSVERDDHIVFSTPSMPVLVTEYGHILNGHRPTIDYIESLIPVGDSDSTGTQSDDEYDPDEDDFIVEDETTTEDDSDGSMISEDVSPPVMVAMSDDSGHMKDE